jgi:hypothetical protein
MGGNHRESTLGTGGLYGLDGDLDGLDGELDVLDGDLDSLDGLMVT